MAGVSDRAAFEASLLSELRRTIRSEIERKLFSGTGSTNQPQGLYNVPGRGTQSFSAALPTFPELISMLKTLANANGNIDQAAFLINTSDWADLLTSTINTEGTATVIDFSGGTYRIGGVRVFLSTAATQGKVCLAQMDRVNLVNYGPPQLIVDAYSSGKSTFGSTELIVQNYLDLIVTDPAALVVGGS